MAIGLTPQYKIEITDTTYTTPQLVMAVLHTAQELGWNVNYLSNSGIIAQTNNGLMKFNAEVKILVTGNTLSLYSRSLGSEFYDFNKNKKTIELFLARFEVVKKEYSSPYFQERYDEVAPHLIPDSQDIIRRPDASGSLEIFDDFISFIKPVDGYFFTPVLLIANILMFIIMVANGVGVMDPASNDLIQWGANYTPQTINGEWWRLITCCFIHIGVLHLLMNMYALMYIGVLLEPMIGKWRFISAYLLTGLAGSTCSLVWHDFTLSAGASGAIFGMYGVYLALLTTNLVEKSTRKPLLISIVIFIVYNLANGMSEGIDNAAHIGGLVSGIIIGYAFIPSIKKSNSLTLFFFTVGLLSILLFVSTNYAMKKVPNHYRLFDSMMIKLSKNDSVLFSVYQLPDSMSVEEKLNKIDTTGIQKNNENITMVDTLSKMQLPRNYKKHLKYLNQYLQLRQKSLVLYHKKIKENTTIYDTQLNQYYSQIDSLYKKRNE